MKKSRFTEEQIIRAIKRQEAGEKTEAICRDIGISPATFYKWKKNSEVWISPMRKSCVALKKKIAV